MITVTKKAWFSSARLRFAITSLNTSPNRKVIFLSQSFWEMSSTLDYILASITLSVKCGFKIEPYLL